MAARYSYNDRSSADFVVACEGRELAVHREVLMTASPFLKKFLADDPTCARINANNAMHAAMDIVLRAIYENPEPGREFRAYHYNTAVITSVWEIAMHFRIETMAAVATARLIQLVNRETCLRVLMATVKHPMSHLAKSLQRHIAQHALPPTMHTDTDAAQWRRLVADHEWLRDAVDAAEMSETHRSVSTASNAAAGAAPVRAPTKTPDPVTTVSAEVDAAQSLSRLDEVREQHREYLSSAAKPFTRSTVQPLPSAAVLSTPKADEDAAYGDDDLAATAQRLRDEVAAAKSELATFAAQVDESAERDRVTAAHSPRRYMNFRSDDDSDGDASDGVRVGANRIAAGERPVRTHGGTVLMSPTQPDEKARSATRVEVSAADAALAAELEKQIAERKAAYQADVAAHRARLAQVSEAARADVAASRRRRDEAEAHAVRLTTELAECRRERDAMDAEIAEGETYARDADQYVRAAAGAAQELASLLAQLPSPGASRSAARRAVAGHVTLSKDQRSDYRAALDRAQQQEAAAQQRLADEEAAVARLQRALEEHDDDDG